MSLTADPGIASSIPAWTHTFVEIDHEIISTAIRLSSIPLIHSRRVAVSYKRNYVPELLVNRLFKPAQEKVWLDGLTVMTIAVDLGRKANKQTNSQAGVSNLASDIYSGLSLNLQQYVVCVRRRWSKCNKNQNPRGWPIYWQ